MLILSPLQDYVLWSLNFEHRGRIIVVVLTSKIELTLNFKQSLSLNDKDILICIDFVTITCGQQFSLEKIKT